MNRQKRNIIKNCVEESVTGFLQGKVNDTIIENFMLCWHGEFSTLVESSVNIIPMGTDGKFSEKDGKWIDLRDYVTRMNSKKWFDFLVYDITNEIVENLDKTPLEMKLDIIRHQVFELGKIQ